MKKDLDHLPEAKRKEIKSIASTIRENCDDVEMVILFGSYARGDYKGKNDLSPNRRSGHVSDYDVLVVTRYKETVHNIGFWDELSQRCHKLKTSAHARLIAHDIQELNIKLAEGQYFFSDVKKEGCLLYDSGNFVLADERELAPKERQRIAQDHFDHWYQRASGAYSIHEKSLEIGEDNWAAFHLHQAAESCYKSILLVFTNYNPHEHLLDLLSRMVVEQDQSFSNIFPKETTEDKNRFDLLDYAYIGARYDPQYRISKKDIQLLAESVKNLLELTETVCKQKIQNFLQ
jgi:uncharacterized protein